MKLKLTELRSEGNVRSDLGDLSDLQESIKLQGVIQPLVVKKNGKGYILLAGHRRLAAAKLAGLKEVPVHVVEIKEGDQAGLQLAENLHRSDLSPSDVADAIGKELKRLNFRLDHDQVIPAGLDEAAKEISLKTGAKLSYVKAMARLAFLPPFYAKLLKNDNLTVTQALMVLQLPAKQQEMLSKNFYRFNALEKKGDKIPTSELESFIERSYGKDLKKAPFPLDEPVGKNIPCLTCSYNTSNTEELFPGAGGGICRMAECYRSKCQTVSTELKEKFLKANPKMEFAGYYSDNGYETKEVKGRPIVKKGNAFYIRRAKEGQGAAVVQVNTVPGKAKKQPQQQGDNNHYLSSLVGKVFDLFADERVNIPAIEKIKTMKIVPTDLPDSHDRDNALKDLGVKKPTWEDIGRAMVLEAYFDGDHNVISAVGIDPQKIREEMGKKVLPLKKEIFAKWQPKGYWSEPPKALLAALVEHVRTGNPFTIGELPVEAEQEDQDE